MLRSGFSRIEQANARSDVVRVRAALNDSISKINGTTSDWAWWDDTYRFVADRNAAYVRSNLGTESISNLRVNTVVIMRPSGQIVFGTGFDLQKNIKVPLAAAFRKQLRPSSPLLKFSHLHDSNQGLIMLPEGPTLIAARPILTSDKQGSSHGTLIFARLLSAKELSALSRLTSFPLQLQRLDTTLVADFRAVRPRLSPSNRIEIHPDDNNTMWGYVLLDDVYGQPALILRVALPRDVHHQEESTLRTMFVSLLGACFAFCAVMFWLLEKVVLGRLEKVNTAVCHITDQHDLTQRVDLHGRDELGLLARAINELLDAIAQSQGDLLESENRFRTFMDNSPAVAFIKDKEGRFVYINATFEKCFGKSSAQVLGRTDHDLWSLEVADGLREHDVTVLRTGKLLQTEEIVPISKTQSTDWLIFKFPLHNKLGGILLAGMGIDITQRKLVEAQLSSEQQKLADANSQLEGLNERLASINRQLEQQALHDELTQLPNRRAFNAQLKIEMERAQRYQMPVSLLLLDIDKFKQINDTWGHPYGDEVLQRVAALLQGALRSTDFAARYGGEEMAVILPHTTAEGALITAERCRKSIAEAPWPQGQVTASFGASTLKSGMEATAFIAAADAALYTSKKEGRNRSTHVEALDPIPPAY